MSFINFKKFVKFIFINLFIFIILFFIFDIVVYYRHIYTSNYDHIIYSDISYISHITRKMNKQYIDSVMFDDKLYKKPLNLNSMKNPIILFGCSFVEGIALKNNETFQYKMAQLSNAPVFDYSRGGWGTQHMLYQVLSDNFYKKFDNNNLPKHVIYTYIQDHITSRASSKQLDF